MSTVPSDREVSSLKRAPARVTTVVTICVIASDRSAAPPGRDGFELLDVDAA
jgi:hypothetical protein